MFCLSWDQDPNLNPASSMGRDPTHEKNGSCSGRASPPPPLWPQNRGAESQPAAPSTRSGNPAASPSPLGLSRAIPGPAGCSTRRVKGTAAGAWLVRGSRVAHGRCGAAYVTSYFWVALSTRGVFSLSLWRDSAATVPTAAIGDRLLGGASSPGPDPACHEESPRCSRSQFPHLKWG